MLKQCKVVMLSTNKKSIIYFNYVNRLLLGFNIERTLPDVSQHLYILSDEEIREGDWCMIISPMYPKHYEQATKEELDRIQGNWKNGTQKKIIATTEPSLELPKPSDSFIQKYIESYNKGNVITDITVEYETYIHNPETNKERHSTDRLYPEDCELEKRAKVNKDNTITIKKVKNSWTRKEVEGYIMNVFRDIDPNKNWESKALDWINNNI